MIERFGVVTTREDGVEVRVHGTRQLPVGAYYNDYTEHEAIWHWHREFELIHMKKGSLRVSVPNEQIILNDGEVLFINSGVMHTAANAGEGKCLFHSVVFSPDFLGNGEDGILWQKYIEPLMDSGQISVTKFAKGMTSTEKVSVGMDRFWNACESEEFGYEFQMRGQLSYVICKVLSEGTQQEKTEKEKRAGIRMKAMLEYLQEHYMEDITVADLAACASVSESECLRCFRNVLKTTPIQYVKKYRLQMAAELLLRTDSTITEIAGRCGFVHMSYFARAFQEMFGVTPRDYRKRVENVTTV